VSPGLCDQIASLRRKLQKIASSRIIFLDETALRLSAGPNNTLVLPGEHANVLATETSSYAARYDMIAVCTGSETFLPKVFTPVERRGAQVKGINSAMLLQFIDDTLAQAVEGVNRYPMTLVLDRASIHLNIDAIRQAFHDRGSQSIKDILLMPANAAKRMSPLDNALFHDWKELCRKRCPVTKRTIEQVMADSWNRLKPKLLHAHFRHCGLMRGQDPYFDCPDPAGHQHGNRD